MDKKIKVKRIHLDNIVKDKNQEYCLCEYTPNINEVLNSMKNEGWRKKEELFIGNKKFIDVFMVMEK